MHIILARGQDQPLRGYEARINVHSSVAFTEIVRLNLICLEFYFNKILGRDQCLKRNESSVEWPTHFPGIVLCAVKGEFWADPIHGA